MAKFIIDKSKANTKKGEGDGSFCLEKKAKRTVPFALTFKTEPKCTAFASLGFYPVASAM